MSLAAGQGKAPVTGDSKCKFPEAGAHPKLYEYQSQLAKALEGRKQVGEDAERRGKDGEWEQTI